MIPPEIIEELKYRNEIEDVISSYVTLKRAGSNFNGLCPFHNEKTPSFTVFHNTQSFYCFGCGAGGDVITFIMRAENLGYVEALEFLAKRAGIAIPQSFDVERNGPSRERLLSMNRDAARFFHSVLKDPEKGTQAREYVYNKRKLSSSIVSRFGLGFAPNSFGELTAHMTGLGYSEEELVSGFLCGRSRKNGKLFDMFRNRLMFPIIDTSGSIIAFGGRVLDDSTPKYLNSSDTPVFKKSRNLFALNFAKNHASERLILCEGYMDVIALHSAGFENAVATLGTAITPEQARIMAKYTKNVIVSYDSDEAGQRAASKALNLLSEVGIDGRVLKVTGAKDPDEFIRSYGKDGSIRFKELLDKSTSRFDFRLDSILKKYDLAVPDEKLRAGNEVCKMLAGIYSSIERELACNAAAKRLGVSMESLKLDTDRAMRRMKREAVKNDHKAIYTRFAGIGDRVNTDIAKNKSAASAEETILGLLLYMPEYISRIKSGKLILNESDFFTAFGKRVFASVMAHSESDGHFEIGALGEDFTPEEMGRIIELRIRREQLVHNGDSVMDDSISKLKAEATTGENITDIKNIIDRKRKDKQDT